MSSDKEFFNLTYKDAYEKLRENKTYADSLGLRSPFKVDLIVKQEENILEKYENQTVIRIMKILKEKKLSEYFYDIKIQNANINKINNFYSNYAISNLSVLFREIDKTLALELINNLKYELVDIEICVKQEQLKSFVEETEFSCIKASTTSKKEYKCYKKKIS